jgi:ribosome biogenesis GTPase A
MDINWYPGHMAKTRRMVEDNLKNIDIAVEILDARIPKASKNPDIANLISNKPRILVLNKSDLSDPVQNKKWYAYYTQQGYSVVLYNSKSNVGKSIFLQKVNELYKDKNDRNLQRGIINRAIRIMILGIPNVGKSTFINNLSGLKSAKTEDRPGVTRSKQWITLSDGIDLLDTPGILWPRLDDQETAEKLAVTGAIKDDVLDIETLAIKLLSVLASSYPEQPKARYKLNDLHEDMHELLKMIGKKRGFIVSGGEIDTERTAIILVDEFRACKIGNISLELL